MSEDHIDAEDAVLDTQIKKQQNSIKPKRQVLYKNKNHKPKLLILGAVVIFLIIILPSYASPRIWRGNSPIKIGIQTVFILKQNVPFMREWILYHKNLGVDLFFLYDNSGKKARMKQQLLRTAVTTKYGFNLSQIVPYTDKQLEEQWKAILKDFNESIIYVSWKPEDESGNIIYNQSESVAHYIQSYGTMVDFTIFIDIDEFVFSKQKRNLKNYLANFLNEGITRVRLHQRKFKDRWCGSNQQRVTQIYQCVAIGTHSWGQKNIIANKFLVMNNQINSIYSSEGRTITAPENQFRINHYNLNKVVYQQMAYEYYSNEKFIKCSDISMQIYDKKLEQLCEGKCSKYFKLKYPEGIEKRKLCYSPKIRLMN